MHRKGLCGNRQCGILIVAGRRHKPDRARFPRTRWRPGRTCAALKSARTLERAKPRRIDGSWSRTMVFNTRKEAEEAARRAGNGKEPRHDPNGKYGPHFHPSVRNEYSKTPYGASKHDHYYYSRMVNINTLKTILKTIDSRIWFLEHYRRDL